MVYIFYGMSGAFKGSTIDALKTEGDLVTYSLIKPYIKLSKEFLRTRPNDLNLAVIRLLQLNEIKGKTYKNHYIERGITDFIESWLSDRSNVMSDQEINMYTSQEASYLSNDLIKRILLVNKDSGFINSTILKEPTRQCRFKDVETYLRRQDEYVNFTKKFNKIDKEIIITDASDYIKKLTTKNLTIL